MFYELYYEIFKYCDKNLLFNLSVTCKLFNEIVKIILNNNYVFVKFENIYQEIFYKYFKLEDYYSLNKMNIFSRPKPEMTKVKYEEFCSNYKVYKYYI